MPMWLIKGYEESMRQVALRQPAVTPSVLLESSAVAEEVAESRALEWVAPPGMNMLGVWSVAYPRYQVCSEIDPHSCAILQDQ